MSWATAVVIIVAIGVIGKVLQARYRAQAGISADHKGNERAIERPTEPGDGEAQREVAELRERIKVLERIATDANTTEARKVKAISEEIESLRDK